MLNLKFPPITQPGFGSRLLSTAGSVLVPASRVHERVKSRIREIDSVTSSPSFHLRDTYNRQHNYLRISLTEKCNLRCFYCMPEEGIELSPDGKLLTNAEILRLATLFVRSGVTKIRLTGGEPTVRKGILDILEDLNKLRKHGLQSIGMTTNGLALHRRLPQFVENGLTHLNLSLDTLDPFKFELITRRRGHEAVLKALDSALGMPLVSIKINVVVIKGLNDDEVLDFIELTREKPISVRFIEFMPFTGNKWDKKKMVESAELLKRIRHRHSNVQRASDELNDTARSWTIPGYKGSFGFISSMSDHFCSTCNRLRLTADGQIKVCLFDAKEISLRDKLREGITDDELLEIIGMAVKGKKEKHAGMEDIDVITNRPMILIGGSYSNHSAKLHAHRQLSNTAPWPFIHPSTIISATQSLRHYSSSRLTHLDEHGRASMVDVSDKTPTKRCATASGIIRIPKVAFDLVTADYKPEGQPVDSQVLDEAESNAIAKARRKGDALTIAQLAGIMGAKQTPNLIPLCHPLSLSKIDVRLQPIVDGSAGTSKAYTIRCTATVTCEGKTGVEMEALTAVSVSLLTVWDMLKALAGKEMEIGQIMVIHKSGGKSGDFERSGNTIDKQ